MDDTLRRTIFRDRLAAAAALVPRLRDCAGPRPLVLGIPRGGVPMAALVARALHGDLDVVLVRKLGFPAFEELALGAVSESGDVFLDQPLGPYGVDRATLDAIVRRELEVIRRRRAMYSPLWPPKDPKGRTVIVVDDGAATGSTMTAALDAVRRQAAARVVAAVPVASERAARRMQAHADEVVALSVPADFRAVGEHYQEFAQVTDEDVVAILRADGAPPRGPDGQAE